MEIAALILSIISIIATSGLAIWQIKSSIKLNKVNIKAYAYEKIFDTYLIKEIPQHRKFVQFDGRGKFIGTEKLITTLKNLLKDALYFRYSKKDFYEKLNKNVQELEDVLVKHTNQVYDSINQPIILSEIDAKMESLYKLIEEKRLKD